MDALAGDKKFKYVTCPIGFIFSLFWLGITSRIVGLVILIFLVLAYVTISIHGRGKHIARGWFVFMAITIQPFDVRFLDFPGPPKFVPYIIGYPTGESVAKASRGEVILGGCLASGFEPKWVLVW
jgi:uncharacterized membrane protein YphA (DoxX/SURF4 family)